MWEDPRAPGWRRRMRVHVWLGRLLLVACVACLVLVLRDNSGRALVGVLLTGIGSFFAYGVAGANRDRLDRPARKARLRAEKAARRARAEQRRRPTNR